MTGKIRYVYLAILGSKGKCNLKQAQKCYHEYYKFRKFFIENHNSLIGDIRVIADLSDIKMPKYLEWILQYVKDD